MCEFAGSVSTVESGFGFGSRDDVVGGDGDAGVAGVSGTTGRGVPVWDQRGGMNRASPGRRMATCG